MVEVKDKIRFQQRQSCPTVAAALVEQQPLLARILANRIDCISELGDLNLSALPDVTQWPELSSLLEPLARDLAAQQSLVVVGDFDADGATATAVIVRGLKGLGCNNISYQLPNRFTHGYGLNPEVVDVILAKQQPQWLMTVDNGINQHIGVSYAKSKGISVIVTDHHLPGESLPAADIIINPQLLAVDSPFLPLAGVGVAFYVLATIRQWFKRWNKGYPNFSLASLLDLVALGTVADLVPLKKINRILVRQGLARIEHQQACPGILALMAVANVNQSFVQAQDLAFQLGPRLNAAGRLQDMHLGVELLLADNFSEALITAQQLDQLNRERKRIETSMRAEADLHLQSYIEPQYQSILVLSDPNWHQGVIGILASRLKEYHHRPVFCFAMNQDGTAKGSGRSVSGLHLRDLLAWVDCHYPDLLIQFGGHAMAAGVSINSSNLPLFERALAKGLHDLAICLPQQAVCLVDGELNGSDINYQVWFDLYRQAGPFGQGFPEPLFCNSFTVLTANRLKDHHWQLRLSLDNKAASCSAIWFFAPKELIIVPGLWRFAYHLAGSVYLNRQRVQLIIQQGIAQFD